MRKIIIVSTVGLIYDGITSVITSYLEAINRDDLEIYVVATIKSDPRIEEKISNLGCHIVHLPSRRENTIQYFLSLISYIKKNNIDVIHAHGNSATLSIEMIAGFLGGCKKRIAHSHNTKCDQVKVDKLLRPLFYLFYTDALACGKEAGEWLFKNRPFYVLKNGRSIEKYAFSEKTREKIRNSYHISDELVLGHVGGFFEQKNHQFLIQVYREILKIRPNTKLFLIGDGPLKKEIEEISSDLGDRVIFIGTTDKVSDYLQAMDGMIFPSLFEGFPLVVIEWQINGLPAVLSDSITKDCQITESVKFESLKQDAAIWANNILKLITTSDRKTNSAAATELVKKAGFDISDNAENLRKIYLS